MPIVVSPSSFSAVINLSIVCTNCKLLTNFALGIVTVYLFVYSVSILFFAS